MKNNLHSEISKILKPQYAIWERLCKKCSHSADNHYWNGGGQVEYSGFDACKTCGCVEYDKNEDFIDKITGYDDSLQNNINALLALIKKHERGLIGLLNRKDFEFLHRWSDGQWHLMLYGEKWSGKVPITGESVSGVLAKLKEVEK